MLVDLMKLIPIVVRVNLETEEIEEVIVCDDDEPTRPWEAGPFEAVTDDNKLRDATEEEVTAALRIIDDCAEWPAWQFGP